MASSIFTTVNKTVTLGAAAYTSPLTITSAGSILLPSNQTNTAPAQNGIFAPAGLSNDSIVNQGMIAAGIGVYSYSGSATAGGIGLDLLSSVAVTNSGSIAGGLGGYSYRGTLGNGGIGIDFAVGGALANTGHITGGAAEYSDHAGGGAGGIGVVIAGAGGFTNSGTTAGGGGGRSKFGAGGAGGTGLTLNAAASFGNTGLIEGGSGGYSSDTQAGGAGGDGAVVASGALANSGTLLGGTGGYSLSHASGAGAVGAYVDGGILINTGSIFGGAAGVSRHGTPGSAGIGVLVNGGTLITSGLIAGMGASVNFGAAASTLVVESGAAFTGNIFANGSNDELAIGGTQNLAIGNGNAKFNNFATIAFESGAQASIYGSVAGLAAGQTIDGFGDGDTIELTGFAATSETFNTGIGLELSNGALTETLSITGLFASNNFILNTGGGNSTITAAFHSIVSTAIASTAKLESWELLTVTGTGGVTPPNNSSAPGVLAPAGTIGAYLSNAGAILGGRGKYAQYYPNSNFITSPPMIGGAGVEFLGIASLLNTGNITGGAGLSTEYAYAAAGGDGVDLSAGDRATNAGNITGGYGGGASLDGSAAPGGAGVSLAAGSTLNNSGTVTGGHGGYDKSDFAGAGGNGVELSSGASLSNTGLIIGGRAGDSKYALPAAGGTGVSLAAGASFANAGQIIGGYSGLAQDRYAVAGGTGVYLGNGATLVNLGSITGGHGGTTEHDMPTGGLPGGVGVSINGGVLIDSGVIAGGAGGFIDSFFQGPQGAAIRFGALAGTLVLDPGAAFSGKVVANSAVADVLELAGSSTGTLSGLGQSFTGFQSVAVEAGAQWALLNSTFGATGTLIDLGTLTIAAGATLSHAFADAGRIIVDGGAADNLVVTLSGANGVAVLNGGALNGGTIEFGTNANIQNGGTANAVTADNAGLVVDSGGIANNSFIEAAGHLDLGTGGTAFDTTIASTGVLNGDGGTITGSLVLDPGAAFTGTVYSAGGVLELAAGAAPGTLDMGGSFSGFSSIEFDAGSSWKIAGDAKEFPTITGFGYGDTIVLDGAAFGSFSYVTGQGLVFDGGEATLDLSGGYATADFLVASAGGLTTISESAVIAAPTITAGAAQTIASGQTVSSPVITAGTLDLSAGSTVEGTISLSGNGSELVIDGTSLANTITGFAPGETIVLAGVPYNAADTVTVGTAGVVTLVTANGDYDLNIAGAYVGETGFSLSGDIVLTTGTPLCYLHGTRILTPTGQVPVEEFCSGDSVVTRFGGIQRIKWLGRQSYAPQFIANHVEKWPVCIRAGALADGVPARDLYVSPGHSMLLGDVLVLATNLVNGVTVTQSRPETEVHYVQIELAAHDCVIAEGAWSETYADAPGLRAQFHNAAEYAALYPDEAPPETLRLCAERPVRRAKLAAPLAPVVARAAAGLLPGPLQGWIDTASDWKIAGWAHDLTHPELPVRLEILVGGEVIGTVLACDFRADLRRAGKGQGRCAFSFTPPRRLRTGALATLAIRRAADGAELPGTARFRQPSEPDLYGPVFLRASVD